jgi:hypothetical protein
VNPQSTNDTEPPTYIFSARELQRLAVYRAAVVARFYNEQCEPVAIRRDSAETPRAKRRAA